MKTKIHIINFIVLFFLCVTTSVAQHNFLGTNKEYIMRYFNNDPEYSVTIDTANNSVIMLTCKTFNQYPYYTYEIDMDKNVCISYAFVSKDKNILNAYLDVLFHIGEVIAADSTMKNVIFRVVKNNKKYTYSVKQPYFDSEFFWLQNIFYVMVKEEEEE